MVFNKERFSIIIPILIIILTSNLAYAESADIPSRFLSLRIEGNPYIVAFEKGKVLYRMGAYREAIAAFSELRKNAPQEMTQEMIEEGLYLKANSLTRLGDYSGAIAVINLIPPKSRFYNFGLYTKALISLNRAKEKDAVEYLEQVSNNYPNNLYASKTTKNKKRSPVEGLAIKAHLTLGFINLDRDNPAEAVKHFAIIPADSPFYNQALFGSGWAYASIGRWVRTVVFWEELSYLYPESKYTMEIIPYLGHAYTMLSAYGKALQQNGLALRYYEDMLKRLSEIERDIKTKEMKGIARAIDIIVDKRRGDKNLGDKKSASELELYDGLASMEEYLGRIGAGIIYEAEALINASKEERRKIIDALSERLTRRIEDLKRQMLEASVNTTLEIARNLRVEGGGQISKDMIFDVP